jgi:hypothetical protein
MNFSQPSALQHTVTGANAAHCQGIPRQASATCANAGHCHGVPTTKEQKYQSGTALNNVYLWGKPFPGAVRSKALIGSRFNTAVAGANPAEIISCVCCKGIGLCNGLIILTQPPYRVCVCVCVCYSETSKVSPNIGSRICNIINTARFPTLKHYLLFRTPRSGRR